MDAGLFTLSQDDWSLHRKGQQDQARHREKVRDAIRKNLSDLISEESIIMTDGRQVVKVPIRSLDEYHFRFNHQKSQHAGQGDGNTSLGDVIARDAGPQGQNAQGQGDGAGDQPGVDYYEAEVSVDDIQEILFSDLELPYLTEKASDEIKKEEPEFRDVRKKGLQSNIDKKRTILETLKRNALSGRSGIRGISPDDLRYKTWEEVPHPHSQAVVLAMMDTSGSPRRP